jgi:hypothetical protein
VKIYGYDPETKEIISYSGRETREDPLEPGRYLISQFATTVALPKQDDDKIHIFEDGKWIMIDKIQNDNARYEKFLPATDWYVIRKIETGKEIPEDILKAREEARNKIARE